MHGLVDLACRQPENRCPVSAIRRVRRTCDRGDDPDWRGLAASVNYDERRIMLTRLLLAASGTVVALSVMPTAAEALSSGCGLTNGSFADSSWLACATTPDLVARVPSRSGIPTASEGALEGATAGGSAQASLSSQTRCTYGNTDTVDGTAAPAPRAGAGRWVFVYCGDAVTTGGWTWTAAAVVYPSPAQLARQAYARLTPVVGTPDYNPRHRSGQSGRHRRWVHDVAVA